VWGERTYSPINVTVKEYPVNVLSHLKTIKAAILHIESFVTNSAVLPRATEWFSIFQLIVLVFWHMTALRFALVKLVLSSGVNEALVNGVPLNLRATKTATDKS